MKKTATTILMFFMTLSLMAAPRTKAQALAIAQKLAGHICSIVELDTYASSNTKTSATTSTDSNEPYYIFNNEYNNGYIIISGEDRLPALIGYTDTGNFDADEMPVQMKEFLTAYTALVDSVEKGSITLASTVNSSNEPSTSQNTTAISPLLGNTTWDQGDPFNQQCPLIDGTRTVTGCGPTAVSQIMHYWKYPAALPQTIPSYNSYDAIELSSNTTDNAYDWDNMLDQYTSSATQNQKDAVAKLMNHVGHVMKATYGLATAGTSTTYDAMKSAFEFYGYNTTLLQKLSKSKYSYSEWKTMITNEIRHSRPILYGAQAGDYGHAFILDGIDTNGLYHVNWGWGGMCNGYFDVTILNPNDNSGIGASTSTDGYNGYAMMVVGITSDQSTSETPYATSGTVPTTSTENLTFSITNKDGEYTLIHNSGCDIKNKIKLTIENNGNNEYYSYLYVPQSTNSEATSNTPIYICVPANSSVTLEEDYTIESTSTSSTYYYTLWNTDKTTQVAQQKFTVNDVEAPQLTVTSITSTASENNLTPVDFNKISGTPTLMLPTLTSNSITYTVTIKNDGGYYRGSDISVGYLNCATNFFEGYYKTLEIPNGESTFTFTDDDITIGDYTGICIWTNNSISFTDNTEPTQALLPPNSNSGYSFQRHYYAYVSGPATNVSVSSYNLASTDNAYYSSLYLDYAVQLPDGVTAYTATIDKANSSVTLNKITSGIVPANTGVILRLTTSGNYELTPCTTAETASSDLQGKLVDTAVSTISSTPYVLSIYNGSPAFQQYNGTTLRANKAYLILPSEAKSYTMSFDDDSTMGVDNVENNNSRISSSTYYNLSGQRVASNTKGIIIINGKKIINKQ